MSQIKEMVADLVRVSTGAWEKKSCSWSPEETVENGFTAAINFYLISYNEACRILGVTRGDNFTELPVDARRKIVLDLGQECEDDRHKFVTGFKENEPAASYQNFLSGEQEWGDYMAARQAVGNWIAFTNITRILEVELPYHRESKRWKPGNLELQTRFAQHLGILKAGQEFGDLEEDQRVIIITAGTKDQCRELQDLDPEIVWARTMDKWNPYGGYMRYYGSPCHFMDFPTNYGEDIRASVKLQPNDPRYLGELGTTSMYEAMKSGLAYPVISLEINPKLILPE